MDGRSAGIRWNIVGGVRMHTRVWEHPRPAQVPNLVLVHGFVMSSRYMVPTAERLAKDHNIFAPDLPGFGKSGSPASMPAIPELAQALAVWMDTLSLDQAVLLGNSMGCQVAAAAAARYPARVAGVVLVGPTVDAQARTVRQQFWRLLIDFLRERPSLLLLGLMDLFAAGLLYSWQTLQAMLRDRIEENLPRIKVPALVVRGSRDTIVPQGWVERVTRLLPQGQLVVLPGAPHAVNYSAPGQLAEAVRPFLKEKWPA